MTRFSFFLLLFLTGLQVGFSQAIGTVYTGFGGAYTSYQDLKYSNVQYGGIGGFYEIGFNQTQEKSMWGAGVSINAGIENAATHDNGQSLVANSTVHFKYLRVLNHKLLVGLRWDILDFYFRNTRPLGNNAIYYLTNSNLYASGMYKIKINDKLKLDTGLDLGLFSFFKESTSFGFSAPQAPLENGEFDYQNESLDNPFGFKYFVFDPLWRHLNLSATVYLHLNNRFSVGYHWKMTRFSEVDNRPVTTGLHTLAFRYNVFRITKPPKPLLEN